MSATVQPAQESAIRQYAKQLRLPTVGEQFARLAEQAVKGKQSYLSYLETLLEGEVEERGRRAIARRIQEARFPAAKTLEEFDFQCTPHIPESRASPSRSARHRSLLRLPTGIMWTRREWAERATECSRRNRRSSPRARK